MHTKGPVIEQRITLSGPRSGPSGEIAIGEMLLDFNRHLAGFGRRFFADRITETENEIVFEGVVSLLPTARRALRKKDKAAAH